MYIVIKVIVLVLCLSGIFYLNRVNRKYQDDTTGIRDDVIKYFRDRGAISVETGIKIKELPNFIVKSDYLLLMVKDKTLVFKKGKYYLNENEEMKK